MNTGLLVLRLVLGLLLVGHGSQKLFGSFGGPGLTGAGGFFDSLGFRPGKPMAIVAGSVHWRAGLWAQKGGYELAFFYVSATTALAFSGPGRYSLDNAIGLHGFAGNGWGVAAVAAGALSELAVVTRGRLALAADAIAQKVMPAHA